MQRRVERHFRRPAESDDDTANSDEDEMADTSHGDLSDEDTDASRATREGKNYIDFSM